MRSSNKEIVFRTTANLELTAVSTYSCELLFSTIKYITLDPKSRLTSDNSVSCIAIKASDDRGRMFLLNAGTIYQTTRCQAPEYVFATVKISFLSNVTLRMETGKE